MLACFKHAGLTKCIKQNLVLGFWLLIFEPHTYFYPISQLDLYPGLRYPMRSHFCGYFY